MKKQESQAWLIVGILFVSWFLVWGGGPNTGSVFFRPVLKYFGWSRAKLSAGFAIAALSAGISGPLIGWLVDRIDVRKVMVTGVALTFLGFAGLSRTHTFNQFLACNLIVGVGLCACTGIPSSLVIANWFRERRGLAMGLALCGASLGGAVMTIVANYVISRWGWRVGYLVIAAPMLVIVIPLLLMYVRTRPTAETQPLPDASAPPLAPVELPGLEVREALATRSLWLLTLVQFLGASVFAGLGQHFVAYLIGIGYTATFAARMLSAMFLLTVFGNLLSGPMADRSTARAVLAGTWIVTAVAMVALLYAGHVTALGLHVLLIGFVLGATGVLTPLLMLESLGIRRFGSLMGISGVFGTLGFAAGPVVTGRIYDVTGSYTIALWLFVAASIVCAIAVLACRPFEEEQAKFARTSAAA
ncbi:MAG TPA: MFS transporter [Candidatus Binataceae bacterium]